VSKRIGWGPQLEEQALLRDEIHLEVQTLCEPSTVIPRPSVPMSIVHSTHLGGITAALSTHLKGITAAEPSRLSPSCTWFIHFLYVLSSLNLSASIRSCFNRSASKKPSNSSTPAPCPPPPLPTSTTPSPHPRSTKTA
jgi:hypothetical protein